MLPMAHVSSYVKGKGKHFPLGDFGRPTTPTPPTTPHPQHSAQAGRRSSLYLIGSPSSASCTHAAEPSRGNYQHGAATRQATDGLLRARRKSAGAVALICATVQERFLFLLRQAAGLCVQQQV